MSETYRLLGQPKPGGMLIVGDHASNHVPDDIDLGIDAALLGEHIAWDVGVAAVAERLFEQHGYTAFLGTISRLVTDFNRYPGEDGVMPSSSDGVEIAGNKLSASEREARMQRFFHPYHDALATVIETQQPSFILFLHSYTPALMSRPDDARPWDIGILYNEDEQAAKLGFEYLDSLPINVGDQLPYTGKIYNATMVRQAEARGIPYFCFEIRQDHVADDDGAQYWCEKTAEMLAYIDARL